MIANHAISQLFEAYHANPLALMREIGIQARLHSLLNSDLKHETCRVQVRLGDGRQAPRPTQFLIERVQMEVRVTDSAGRGPKKSDIVILRSTPFAGELPITATCYANGPFDIVSKIHRTDAAAVIEIKAACSADLSARHSFRLDLDKLLQLAETYESGQTCPELHFVLVDKSVAVRLAREDYGSIPAQGRVARRDWHIETEASLAEATLRGRQEFWHGGGPGQTKPSPRMELLDQAPAGGAFVRVWQLDVDDHGVASSHSVRSLYAVRSSV